MEYFFWCRDRPGTLDLRWQLVEEHWRFMDAYAARMIARGPTLTPDRSAPTGSVHIVDLPDAEAARRFAFEEPNYRAGVYADVLIRRFENRTGRTMWQFPGTDEEGRFLILGHARPGSSPPAPLDDDRVIVQGPLYAEDGTTWLGTAVLAEGSAILDASAHESVETHPWQFGGRR
jgi:uncharacterized protein YciI